MKINLPSGNCTQVPMTVPRNLPVVTVLCGDSELRKLSKAHPLFISRRLLDYIQAKHQAFLSFWYIDEER